MPAFPIIDTHVHLSNTQRLGYTHIKEEAPSLFRDFTLGDYLTATGPVEIEAMVFMEVACDLDDVCEEVAWVTELAAEEERLAGIVAHAPLEQVDRARTILESHAQYPLVKGIRRLLQSEADDFCLRDDFLEGLRLLPEHDFSTREDLRPFVDHVVECFGFDRILHGGDWFVMTLASTWPQWIDALDWALSGCSEQELRKFYVENAKTFYRL